MLTQLLRKHELWIPNSTLPENGDFAHFENLWCSGCKHHEIHYLQFRSSSFGDATIHPFRLHCYIELVANVSAENLEPQKMAESLPSDSLAENPNMDEDDNSTWEYDHDHISSDHEMLVIRSNNRKEASRRKTGFETGVQNGEESDLGICAGVAVRLGIYFRI